MIFCLIILIYFLYENKYYKSEKFLNIKNSIKNNIKDCNDLNEHIEILKHSYVDFNQIDYGEADYKDASYYNYKRPKLKNITNTRNIYNCSLTVCKNAQQQPFKYICKYFNIPANEESLIKFEKVLNDFSAAEQGKQLLINEQNRILNSIINDIPFLIKKIGKKKLIKRLGFNKININQLYFPVYTFRYVSAGGNASTQCNFTFNIDNLNKFVKYLSEIVKFRKSVAGQRALMTSELREKIKRRDNYTCKKCGLSTKDEPNLLLEIDHIIPLSKNGLTTENNLQTLCWKCNRTKSSKIEDNIE